METDQHICTTKTAKRPKRTASKRKKETSEQYKCGGCDMYFQTVCVLHDHCIQRHDTSSYIYDNLTRTALPKYGNVCVYTQVDPDLIDAEVRQSGAEVSVSVEQGCPAQVSDPTNDKHETKTKQSKSKASKSKGKAKQKNKKQEAEESKKEDKSVTVNSDNVAEALHDSNNTIHTKLKEQLKTKVLQNVKESDSLNIVPTNTSESPADINKSTESLSPESVTKDPTRPRYSKRTRSRQNNSSQNGNKNDNLEESQKTDELAASEALIAFSEGLSTISVKQELSNAIEELQRQLNAEADVPTSKDEAVESRLIELSESPANQETNLRNNTHSRNNTHAKNNSEKATSEVNKIIEKKTRDKSQNVESKGPARSYKCEVCGKVGSATLMSYHKYMHAEEKEFTCETCGASFKSPICLQVHQKQHSEKEFKCTICSAAFHRKQYLRTHMMKHTGEVPYMCDLCGKSYREKNNLARHIRHVHEKVRNYECDICKEKFFRSDHLKNHRLRHSEASKKCPYCPRMFKHPDDLLRHTKTHTGEKKWHCNLCGHGFVSVSPYYVHMLKKHGINREDAKVLKSKLQAEHKARLAGAQSKNKTVLQTSDESNHAVLPGEVSKRTEVQSQARANNISGANNISSNLGEFIYTAKKTDKNTQVVYLSNSVTQEHRYSDVNNVITKNAVNADNTDIYYFDDGDGKKVLTRFDKDAGIQDDYSEVSEQQTIVSLQACDLSIHTTDEQTHETADTAQYRVLGYGTPQIMDDGQMVILEDGPCLDHLEIEIGAEEFGGDNLNTVMFVDSDHLSEIAIQNS